MVNFLRNQSRGGGNSTADMLRQQLALSAAQRISGLQANRFNQEEPQPELIQPNFLDTMAPAIGKGIEYAAGREQQQYQQAREAQQQEEATEELANIYAQEFDIPIERARLIASAPPEERKAVLADLNARRKEERSFENKKELEGLKFENKIKLSDYKKEIDAKFPKDDPNRQWYRQGLIATQKLKSLSKDTKFDPQGYWDKWGYERENEEAVRNWITMGVAASTPLAHLSASQQKELEASYLEQYYKDKPSREGVIERLEGTFTPANFESLQERGSQMQQQLNNPQLTNEQQAQQIPQEQEPVQDQQSIPEEQQMSSQPETWTDWATRAAGRAVSNYGERAASALAYGPTGVVTSLAGDFAHLVAPYMPEFIQKSIAINESIMNPFKGLSPEELKKISPETKKILEPQGRLDRITDSITRELPDIAMGYGLGTATIKPLVAGLLGGVSDEVLDKIKAPEIAKLGARLITSLAVSGGYNALKDIKNEKQPMQYLTKVVRKEASQNYNEAKKLATGITVDTQQIKDIQSQLNEPDVSNAIPDQKTFKNLKRILNSFSKITPEPSKVPSLEPELGFFEAQGKRVLENKAKFASSGAPITSVEVQLPTLFKGYRDLGKLERKETDKDMKELLKTAKDAVWNSIQSAAQNTGKAQDAVLKWNAANSGWAATEQLNSIERTVAKAHAAHPTATKAFVLSAISSALGFGSYLSTLKGLGVGAGLAAGAGLGSAQRLFQYSKRPEVQKLFYEFLESGLSHDTTASMRNYRDIIDALKKAKGASK